MTAALGILALLLAIYAVYATNKWLSAEAYGREQYDSVIAAVRDRDKALKQSITLHEINKELRSELANCNLPGATRARLNQLFSREVGVPDTSGDSGSDHSGVPDPGSAET